MTDIYSMNLAEIEYICEKSGQPRYRAKQIFSWVLKSVSFPEMSNLPSTLKEYLASQNHTNLPSIVDRRTSKLDGTVKYLWALFDGNYIESALMDYDYGKTVCISTQAGCKMGCLFCASTGLGFARNLLASEMLAQVAVTSRVEQALVKNVVLMGVGEPLDNLENVIRFLELLSHSDGFNIGLRHITLSTCGAKGKIRELARHKLQITLSVSLHAPDDDTRNKIMPVNKSNGVLDLMNDCRYYYEVTGRRVSFEYALMEGINDAAVHAERLVRLLRTCPGHVNLITFNRVPESSIVPSSRESTRRFRDILLKNGINVTVRRRLGTDIAAACGQLRRGILRRVNV